MVERAESGSALERLQRALASAGVEHADLYSRGLHRGFARFSLNALNQHADTIEEMVTARVAMPTVDGFRIASSSTDDVSHESLVTLIHRARDLAQRSPAVPGWPGFTRSDQPTPTPLRFAEATAQCTPADRAKVLAPALAFARESKLTAAGVLETTVYEVAVANTAGTARHARGSTSSFKMFALDSAGTSGFSQCTHRDFDKLDVLARARTACEKSLAGHDPVALPPGEYDVVLEPPAVCELLEWLSFIALGAREVSDGTSPLAGRAGQTITGSNITLVDDACESGELGFGIPFDRDGIVRERVVLIDHGVAREPVYDVLYGARLGHRSTGHAAPPGGLDDGPVAQSVRLEGGTDTLEALGAGVQRGLHISRFHYVNGFLDPRRAVMTGLTRDGTFLIENGVRTRGVRNMRFTDSAIEAFARADGITALREAVPTWWSEAGAFVAPAMRIRGFRFTGGGVA